MGNDFFRFKQFEIKQDQCAMKVSTDACLLGALAAYSTAEGRFLDIGCGTGLLSLFLAQRYPKVMIDAIEIESGAAAQAKNNVLASPWKQRIAVQQADVKQWSPPYTYEGIICNPPFFEGQLKSTSPTQKIARHEDTLSKSQLAEAIGRLLSAAGEAVLLFPTVEHDAWAQEAAQQGLFCKEQWRLKPLPHKPVNRIISTWVKHPAAQPANHELTLYQQPNQLSQEVVQHLKDFYLFL